MVNLFILIFSLNLAFAAGDIEKFEQTAISDKSFPSVAFVGAKAHFSNKNHMRTLAITLFYRTNFLDAPEKTKFYFQEAYYQLEILALADFCQWEITEELMKEYKSNLDSLKMSSTKWDELKKQLAYAKILQKSSPQPNDFDETFKDNEVVYPLDEAALKKLQHPKHLILKLKNKCPGRL